MPYFLRSWATILQRSKLWSLPTRPCWAVWWLASYWGNGFFRCFGVGMVSARKDSERLRKRRICFENFQNRKYIVYNIYIHQYTILQTCRFKLCASASFMNLGRIVFKAMNFPGSGEVVKAPECQIRSISTLHSQSYSRLATSPVLHLSLAKPQWRCVPMCLVEIVGKGADIPGHGNKTKPGWDSVKNHPALFGMVKENTRKTSINRQWDIFHKVQDFVHLRNLICHLQHGN